MYIHTIVRYIHSLFQNENTKCLPKCCPEGEILTKSKNHGVSCKKTSIAGKKGNPNETSRAAPIPSFGVLVKQFLPNLHQM